MAPCRSVPRPHLRLDLAAESAHVRAWRSGHAGKHDVVQLQMLFPAFSAIVLGMFFFPESPLYYRRPAGPGRWFYFYFLLLTVISALGILGTWLGPAQGTVRLVAAIVPQVLAFVGLLLLIVLRLVAGHEAMSRVWLSWETGETGCSLLRPSSRSTCCRWCSTRSLVWVRSIRRHLPHHQGQVPLLS